MTRAQGADDFRSGRPGHPIVGDRQLTDEAGRLAALSRYRVLDSAPEAQFDKITALVQAVLGVPISAVSLISSDRQVYKSGAGLDVTETPRNIAFCNHTITSRDPLIICDAALDPRFTANPLVTGSPGIRAYAGVPLRSPDGYNLGALCAIDTSPREFPDAHIEILQNFAALVVNELELRLIAQRDFLTGALTRRAFVEALADETRHLDRQQRRSVLVMFDIDRFKKVNDRLGHPVGDEVLKIVAGCIDQTLPCDAVFGRLGGEEFGVLLRDMSVAEALASAEQMRRCIGKLAFVAAPGLKVTASFGVADLEACDSVELWMSAADAALYCAKRGGRDRSVVGGCGDLRSRAA
jgi:diguanylate cyclase (GGDEF)-like protein